MVSQDHDSEYSFACRDSAGRPARGAVLVREGELVVVLREPGTSSFGDVDQVRGLCSVLGVAAGELRAQREQRRPVRSER